MEVVGLLNCEWIMREVMGRAETRKQMLITIMILHTCLLQKKRVLIFHTWECNINCHRALSPMSFLRLRKTTMTAMRMISEGMMPPVVDVHHIRKCWREEGELIFSTTFPYSKRGEVKFHIHCQQPSSRQGSIWHTFPVSGC